MTASLHGRDMEAELVIRLVVQVVPRQITTPSGKRPGFPIPPKILRVGLTDLG
jgi:hypothetical protein